MNDLFARFATRVAELSGRPLVFAVAVATIVAWALSGPFLRFSEQWQLLVNTGTTVVTFLMVLLIQNSQNRSTLALQIKLDEIIRAVRGARNTLIDLEDLSEEELEMLRDRFARMGERARNGETGSQPRRRGDKRGS
jgi:low affinity Fe/Cu permease